MPQLQSRSENRYPTLTKATSLGAGFAFLVISLCIFGIDKPHPEWGKFWMLRPLIITPLSGAIGGAFFYFINYKSYHGFKRLIQFLLSLLIYGIGLWTGIILGLDGTMWD